MLGADTKAGRGADHRGKEPRPETKKGKKTRRETSYRFIHVKRPLRFLTEPAVLLDPPSFSSHEGVGIVFPLRCSVLPLRCSTFSFPLRSFSCSCALIPAPLRDDIVSSSGEDDGEDDVEDGGVGHVGDAACTVRCVDADECECDEEDDPDVEGCDVAKFEVRRVCDCDCVCRRCAVLGCATGAYGFAPVGCTCQLYGSAREAGLPCATLRGRGTVRVSASAGGGTEPRRDASPRRAGRD